MKQLTSYALQFVGLPYIWGGDDPIDGFDCSGLVQEILASVGMDPIGDQTADALYRYFSANNSSKGPKAGALVFYGTTAKVTHIAFMVDDFRIVEAGGGGRASLSRELAAQQNAYVRVRPYDNRKDIVAVISPAYPARVVV